MSVNDSNENTETFPTHVIHENVSDMLLTWTCVFLRINTTDRAVDCGLQYHPFAFAAGRPPSVSQHISYNSRHQPSDPAMT
jgi:hypothetical protein